MKLDSLVMARALLTLVGAAGSLPLVTGLCIGLGICWGRDRMASVLRYDLANIVEIQKHK